MVAETEKTAGMGMGQDPRGWGGDGDEVCGDGVWDADSVAGVGWRWG